MRKSHKAASLKWAPATDLHVTTRFGTRVEGAQGEIGRVTFAGSFCGSGVVPEGFRGASWVLVAGRLLRLGERLAGLAE